MLKGIGRHQLTGSSFSKRVNYGEAKQQALGEYKSLGYGYESTPAGSSQFLPRHTNLKSFASPTSVPINAGLIPHDHKLQIALAREIYDNDPIPGAVVETFAAIPFGAFSLAGLPDKQVQKPYEISLDRIRSKSLMPVLATSHLVDGAFLGGGLFDESKNVWNSIIPYDNLYAEIVPAPFFGATPIVDVRVNPETTRGLKENDERMQRYRKYLPESYFTSGGTIRLPLENTFYVPRHTRSENSLGVSLYRKIMVMYLLDRALMRGTITMAHRRQRPMIHIQTGDENWEASTEEMSYISNLFQSADLDPLGAHVVTRPGVIPQEVGGLGDMWKWTDTVDVMSSMKLKGLGMPDGLLGGDAALDSVSATLTIFIKQIREFRETVTRLFFYEKFFPYIAITNGHRKSDFKSMEFGTTSYGRDIGEEIDQEDYFTPTIAWHSSMRPEGDREYMELLDGLRQAGVPIPIRVMAAAGGLDLHDILNSAPNDIEDRKKVAEINAQIAAMDQASGMSDDGMGSGQGDDSGGGDSSQQFASDKMYEELSPIKRKGIMQREYDYERTSPANTINGKRYVMTARERRRIDDKINRLAAKAAADHFKIANRQKPRFIKPARKSSYV